MSERTICIELYGYSWVQHARGLAIEYSAELVSVVCDAIQSQAPLEICAFTVWFPKSEESHRRTFARGPDMMLFDPDSTGWRPILHGDLASMRKRLDAYDHPGTVRAQAKAHRTGRALHEARLGLLRAHREIETLIGPLTDIGGRSFKDFYRISIDRRQVEIDVT